MLNLKNVSALAIAFATFSTVASASPLTHVLPADAKNVQISSLTLGTIMTGQKLISDGQDGPVYENLYSPALDVTVTYESSDRSDDATALDNSNDPIQVVVGGPTLNFSLQIPEEEANLLKVNNSKMRSMVNFSLKTENVRISNEEFSNSCRFNNDSSQVENPECIVRTYTTQVRPMISIDRN